MPSPVTKTLRIVLALSAFFALAFTVAACGGDDDSNDVPSNAVASVDGSPVTKADYDRWAEITAKSASAQGGTAVIPDPPNYTECVAALTRQARSVRGQRVPSESALRAQCRQLDTQIRQQTLALLIQAIWFDKEAEDLGIDVSDADVRRLLEETKRSSFPRRGDYERFLRQTGMSNEDVLFRLRIQRLGEDISRKVQRDAGSVTEAQVTAYYNRNRDQFAVPERRDLEIILTRTEAQANEAKRAIEGGTELGCGGEKILDRRALEGQRRQTRRRRQRPAGQSARHGCLLRRERRHRRPGREVSSAGTSSASPASRRPDRTRSPSRESRSESCSDSRTAPER